jgi:RNA polymerase sigma-70 factor (ECF subfamily)
LASSERDAPLGDEHNLVLLAQQGDRRAFAVLVERYWNSLYRWLNHLCHDHHAAEDFVQEAFLRAFAQLSSFEAGTNFRAWLFRIAHNHFISRARAEQATRLRLPKFVAGLQPGPIEEVIRREVLGAVARGIGRLPREFRAAFLLRAEERLSFREIASVLAISEETARWRVFKARQKLMGSLGSALDEEKP